ncbi:hypothetical protein [Peptoniphilus catoniae]|uniref:hypothetical protein n=1 Tax=Peptoniphilus catoniae TaxID=1660341 RepID=UPI0010FD8249|nr:hypothetical protein [Peptoniphilus catoniae]
MKKLLTLSLVFTFVFSGAVFAETKALPSEQKVLLNGKEVNIQGYNIDSNNYYRLRDLAAILTGTDINFNVGFNESTGTIEIQRETPYTKLPGDLNLDNKEIKTIEPSSQKVTIDKRRVLYSGYLINDNNFFKLRDLGKTIGFYVDYNEDTNSVIIKTQKLEPIDLINREKVNLISLASDTKRNKKEIKNDGSLKEIKIEDFTDIIDSAVFLTNNQKQLSVVSSYYDDKEHKIYLLPEFKFDAEMVLDPLVKVKQGDKETIINPEADRITLQELGKYVDASKDFSLILGFYEGESVAKNFRGLSIIEISY